ncbi:porin family protein [Hymenobacter crusticola]|uniref:Outer membrane protein beta-barrel domain-containing protein n=1 Tax=Hymenobacter crusticola TaxID=1770526 RepID=A0A243W9W4_9BACT|nr:porin family protein [Hymenobacter crusticola]OUJ72144.1 hypothetical protein BXP70_19320 [Hymenobacter crusticola]
MLRTSILLLLGLQATSTLHAQDIRFGVKAGLNVSTYRGGEVSNPRFRLGPAAGAFVRLPLSTRLDLQPELLCEQRGARTSYTSYLLGGTTSARSIYRERSLLHYVSLPVLVRLSGAKWFAVAGPQLSYLVAARRRGSTSFESSNGLLDPALFFREGTSVRGTDGYYRWELGCAVGVGYQPTARLGVEVRYASGFTPVRRPLGDDTTTPTNRTQGIHNSSLQAQVSYQLSTL